MDREVIFHQIEKWGYYLLPKFHRDSPGYRGLLVAIRAIPTNRHFDPELISLQVYNQGGGIDSTSLTFSSPVQDQNRACPGRVVLYDRFNKQVNFYTFGGLWEAFTEPGQQIYLLRSSAPILELRLSLDHPADQLAAEVELMLAVFRARWQLDRAQLTRHLSRWDPFLFYRASLVSILFRYERAPALRRCFYPFYRLLCHEKDWLKELGQWPNSSNTLGKLLGYND